MHYYCFWNDSLVPTLANAPSYIHFQWWSARSLQCTVHSAITVWVHCTITALHCKQIPAPVFISVQSFAQWQWLWIWLRLWLWLIDAHFTMYFDCPILNPRQETLFQSIIWLYNITFCCILSQISPSCIITTVYILHRSIFNFSAYY